MSQYYAMGDRTLWNPSNGASRLFLGQVAVYEAELSLPSGIGPMEDDECQIDADVFGAFVEALLAWYQRTRHAVIGALAEGFVATVLVLARRAGIEAGRQPVAPDVGESGEDVQIPTASASSGDARARAAALRLKSQELSRFMTA
ncbi:DUF6086 family protein [Streptomyces sp. Da 82-17]|uniref:DUF6086 family protein n=1 Tax=Streptomyces sp. Da 82-17 TaxID=3377116 RepID=UPI0038D4177A